MLRGVLFHVGLPALVVGTLLSVAAPCEAQIGFGRGMGIGIGFGRYGGYPAGWGGYPMMGYGSGVGIGFGRGYYGGPYYNNYGYDPAYYGYYEQPVYQYQAAYPQEPAPLTDHDVLLRVEVPNTAQVWVNGEPTTQTGMRREYMTNDLTPGRTYTYSIKARWTEDGKPVERERKVKVHGGEMKMVNFNVPS